VVQVPPPVSDEPELPRVIVVAAAFLGIYTSRSVLPASPFRAAKTLPGRRVVAEKYGVPVQLFVVKLAVYPVPNWPALLTVMMYPVVEIKVVLPEMSTAIGYSGFAKAVVTVPLNDTE
jgi:hypothetical protein